MEVWQPEKINEGRPQRCVCEQEQKRTQKISTNHSLYMCEKKSLKCISNLDNYMLRYYMYRYGTVCKLKQQNDQQGEIPRT